MYGYKPKGGLKVTQVRTSRDPMSAGSLTVKKRKVKPGVGEPGDRTTHTNKSSGERYTRVVRSDGQIFHKYADGRRVFLKKQPRGSSREQRMTIARQGAKQAPTPKRASALQKWLDVARQGRRVI